MFKQQIIKKEKVSNEPLSLKKHKLSHYIITSFSGILITFILTAVDYLSVGSVFFPSNFSLKNIPQNHEIITFNYQSISRLLFVLSSIISMIINNLVTKIGWGIYAGSIIENLFFTQSAVKNIIKVVYNKYKHLENNKINNINEMVIIVIVNTIFCFMLSTLLFSLFSFIFYISNISKLLEYIPSPIICGFMGGIAWGQFKTFLENIEIKSIDLNNLNNKTLNFLGKNIHLKMFIYGSIIGIIIYLLVRIFPKFSLTIVLIIFISTIITYLIALINYKGNYLIELRKLKYIKEKGDDTFFNILKFFKIIFLIKYLDFEVIWSCKFAILNIGIFSMLHFPINYSVYRSFISSFINNETIIKKYCSSLSNEMKTQMIMNLIGAFTTFIPSYIVGSYSIAFFRGGGRSKLIGIMGAICNITLPYIGPIIYSYMPVFIVSSIPFYISCCFLNDFLIDIYNKIKSLIFKKPKQIKNKNIINYEKLNLKDFISYNKLPSYLRYCDFYDFIISFIVLILFILLDDYTIISLLIGFFLCFLKQYFIIFNYYYNNKEKNKLGIKFLERDFGCNFIQSTIYNNKKYKIYQPITINFWNLRTFDKEDFNKIIFDFRKIVYIDILAASKFNENILIIY